ncbi:hypothetical protein HS125_11405 [bacterium]|nr:hypothetical protein [bacterium]
MSDIDIERERVDDSIPTDPGESLRAFHSDYMEAQARASEAGSLFLQECLEGLVAVFNRVENLPDTLADLKKGVREIASGLEQTRALIAQQGALQGQILEQLSELNHERAGDAHADERRETGEASR